MTFNARQRIVIVAEDFPGEMEQTLRYLRGRLGIDVTAVRFGVHQLEREILLETDIVVGRESVGVAKTAPAQRKVLDHDQVREKVDTPFLKDLVDEVERWIEALPEGIRVQHNQGTEHSIYRGSMRLGSYYFATKWMRFYLRGRRSDDEAQLAQLSNPSSALVRPKRIAGNVMDPSDLEIFRSLLLARLVDATSLP